jgi:inhibitor of cysteine peptidase
VELTQDDAGATRRVRVGEKITVVLPENPTTGYRWAVEVDTAALPVTADEYDGGTHPVGAAGTRRLTFVPKGPGQAKLRLVKRRAWETKAVADFEVDLEVTAD